MIEPTNLVYWRKYRSWTYWRERARIHWLLCTRAVRIQEVPRRPWVPTLS